MFQMNTPDFPDSRENPAWYYLLHGNAQNRRRCGGFATTDEPEEKSLPKYYRMDPLSCCVEPCPSGGRM
jgi:hypothetical protein